MAISDALGLALGNDFACARRATGVVACWGDNGARQLGADAVGNWRSTPILVRDAIAADAIAAGDAHACIRQGARAILCWGNNSLNQLGIPVMTSSATPVPVFGL
jgi:alpha-tubulin suppressor-like RCC1 family protein